MLNGKQKRYLRALASKEKALFQIGKEGINDNFIDLLKSAIKARELVKISILKTCELEANEVAIDLAAASNSEIVQIIGRTIILFKQSKEKKIVLPK